MSRKTYEIYEHKWNFRNPLTKKLNNNISPKLNNPNYHLSNICKDLYFSYHSCCCCFCCCCYCYFPSCEYKIPQNNKYQRLNLNYDYEKINILKGRIYYDHSSKSPNIYNKNEIQKEELFPDIEKEKSQLNEFFKKLMEVETKIENKKIELAEIPDFNFEDIFNIFDSDNKGYVEKKDFYKGLNLLGLNPHEKDLRLIMKRFDLEKIGYLNYADFFEIIVAKTQKYREEVENRKKDNELKNELSPEVKSKLKELFILIIKLEYEINDMRKCFTELKPKLKILFQNITGGEKQNLNFGKFKKYLNENGIFDDDLEFVFIRLVKGNKKEIEFSNLEDEVQALY